VEIREYRYLHAFAPFPMDLWREAWANIYRGGYKSTS
jgi:hypothetical protein